jgi:hypothetical protein
MSEELLSVLKWLAVIVIAAVAYEPLGRLIASNSHVFGMFSCYLMAYISVALAS